MLQKEMIKHFSEQTFT